MQSSRSPDYTYEYHWGRILAVGALLVGLGATALFLLFLGDKTPTTNTVVKIEANRDAVPPEAQAQEVMAAEASLPEETVALAETVETAETPTLEVEHSVAAADEPAESVIEKAVSATEIKIERPSQVASDIRTKAELFTAAIKRAKLTGTVNRREPGEAIPKTLSLENNGLSKVYFYTEVVGQAGKTHYHHWYHNGELKAKVPITIGSDRWRCYSSKYLTQNQTGEWTVKVQDAKGTLLAQSNFNFTNQ